jgi:hypothetical protein
MHPGVFVSKAATGDWQPDPDVPGSEMHELVHRDGVGRAHALHGVGGFGVVDP